MRILHVIRDLAPSTGGPVTAVQGMAAAEADLRHTVSVVSTDFGLTEQPRVNDVTITAFPCRLSSWRYSQELAKALPSLIKSSDIVHIHTIWEHPTWVTAKICKRLGKPYILRPCGMLDRWSLTQSAWKKKVYLHLLAASVIRNAAALHFTSEEELTNSLNMGRVNRGFVVPNGLPASAIENLPDPRAFCQRFPELTEKRLVLFLSRLHYKKQPDVVIKAFHRVCGMDDRLTLVLAGPAEPAYMAELKKSASDLHLTDRIIFTGMLQGVAVREAYRAAEIFVLPSLQENFGIAVAEAMAAGCPVVVSEQVNLETDIQKAKAGIVCTSDIESTAAAMKTLLADESLRVQMGANGRTLVQEKFCWSKAASELTGVYEDILSSRRTSDAWR